MSITHIQIRPMTKSGLSMLPATKQDVEYGYAIWSVYAGAPGAFDWQADFQNAACAKDYAQNLAAFYDADLIEGNA